MRFDHSARSDGCQDRGCGLVAILFHGVWLGSQSIEPARLGSGLRAARPIGLYRRSSRVSRPSSVK